MGRGRSQLQRTGLLRNNQNAARVARMVQPYDFRKHFVDRVPIRLVVSKNPAKEMLQQVVGSGSSTGAGSTVWDIALGKPEVQPAPGEQILIELAASGPYLSPLRLAFIGAQHRLLEADEALVTEGQHRLEMFDPPEVFKLLCIQAVQQCVHQMEADRLQRARFSRKRAEISEVSNRHGSQHS